jgi:hypothetical protein
VVWQWRRNRAHRQRDSRGEIVPQEDRSKDPFSDAGWMAGLRSVPTRKTEPGDVRIARDVIGTSPAGLPVEFLIDHLDRPALLAFLHTNCDGCDEYWSGFGHTDRGPWPHSVWPAIVTRGPESVGLADIQQAAAGVREVPVIMSDQAWIDYQVLGYPFFVLIEPESRTVIGETVGFGWADVISMIRSSGY